jgi:cytochrome P450
LLRQEQAGGLTREEVKDNIVTFIGAGHETTARALGWTLYCLANAEDERHLLEEEIDCFFRGDAVPPEQWIEHLPRTRAAFEEALRLYPPAPSINRAAIEDDRYGDLVIKAGVTVLIMPWTLHRHRRLWDEPEAFRPSRFWPENRDKIDRFQYLPFGAGPRICIGASFALQEAVIALAVLLYRFRFSCTADCKPWPVQKLTTQPEGGLPMTVSRRRAA